MQKVLRETAKIKSNRMRELFLLLQTSPPWRTWRLQRRRQSKLLHTKPECLHQPRAHLGSPDPGLQNCSHQCRRSCHTREAVAVATLPLTLRRKLLKIGRESC